MLPGTTLRSLFGSLADIVRGHTTQLRIELDGVAPNEGATVALTVALTVAATDAQVLSGITIPKSVTIPAGQKGASFPIAVASEAVAKALKAHLL